MNLAAALLCTNVVFLCGIDRTEYYRGCAAIAAILQYFLLVSFSWMLVEGVLHYLKFVKVLDAYVYRFMLKAASFAWGMYCLALGNAYVAPGITDVLGIRNQESGHY